MFGLDAEMVQPGRKYTAILAADHGVRQLQPARLRDVLFGSAGAGGRAAVEQLFPPGPKRAGAFGLAPDDGGRRLDRHVRGDHRTAPRRGEDQLPGAPRRPDRAAQPPVVPIAAGRADCFGQSARRELRAVVHRPRSLQGGQRHARPPGRRPASGGGVEAVAELRARWRHDRPTRRGRICHSPALRHRSHRHAACAADRRAAQPAVRSGRPSAR